MPDYSDYHEVVKMVGEAMDADRDNRERVRESVRFLNKKNGQWDTYLYSKLGDDRLRMTFDRVSGIIQDKSGDVTGKSYGLVIKPTGGGEASSEKAKQINGLIRTIENLSGAETTYNSAIRKMIGSGLAGWEVAQEYLPDSFAQDLVIKPVHDFVNRVWFLPGGVKETQEDAPGLVVIDHLTKSKYEEGVSRGLW